MHMHIYIYIHTYLRESEEHGTYSHTYSERLGSFTYMWALSIANVLGKQTGEF